MLPKGFKAAGIYCGIKASKKKDLGLIYSKLPCSSAGMFTTNKAQAESLKVCKAQIKNKVSRVVIANSGNANCFVGKRGITDAKSLIKDLSSELGISSKEILIASTGIIGKPLPVNTIRNSISVLCENLSEDGASDFATAIMTTDTREKIATADFKIDNKLVRITGMAKGVGMVYPKMKSYPNNHATVLVFIMTDISIKRNLLKMALEAATNASFNSISVDGCMSTNDTVLALANGAAGNKIISKKDKDFELFSKKLLGICKTLSTMLVDDGEGATKRIEIMVKGSKSEKEAVVATDAVANSSLFKTAMFGNNPNWGRIAAAIGASGIDILPEKLQIWFNEVKIFDKGRICLDKSKNPLKGKRIIKVVINLNNGKASWSVMTCDLSYKYVKINAEYN